MARKKIDAATATPLQKAEAAARRAFATSLSKPTSANVAAVATALGEYRKAFAAEFSS